jgi:hypothetical protein
VISVNWPSIEWTAIERTAVESMAIEWVAIESSVLSGLLSSRLPSIGLQLRRRPLILLPTISLPWSRPQRSGRPGSGSSIFFSVANGAQAGFRGHRRAVASRLGTQVVPDLHCTVSLGDLVLFWYICTNGLSLLIWRLTLRYSLFMIPNLVYVSLSPTLFTLR